MKNNLFKDTLDSKVFDFILGHEHGKIQARAHQAYIQLDMFVHDSYRETFTMWAVTIGRV